MNINMENRDLDLNGTRKMIRHFLPIDSLGTGMVPDRMTDWGTPTATQQPLTQSQRMQDLCTLKSSVELAINSEYRAAYCSNF